MLYEVITFQEELERQSWLQGGMKQTAPAQRMVDSTNRKLGVDLPKSSYSPGLLASPLHFWLPDFISKRLAQGFLQFGKSCHGFLTNEAVMMGVETRTSSPIRRITSYNVCYTKLLRVLTYQIVYPQYRGWVFV